MSRADHDRAYAELRRREFGGGNTTGWTQTVESHSKDALNAIWEHVFNRESSFPVPALPAAHPDEPGRIRPTSTAATAWPTKVLGRFTERDLTIIKIRWNDRAEFVMPDNRTYCMFTNAGTIEVAGHQYGRHTVVWSDYGEEVVVFGEPGAEALCIAFPPIEFAPDLTGRASGR